MAKSESGSDGPVVIVGGGIGGLASALSLARAGQEVLVLEKAPEFAEIGAGLQLAPNATRVLESLGLLEKIKSLGVLPNKLVIRAALTDTPLTYLEIGEDFLRRYETPYVVMHRNDLLSTILQACQEESSIELCPGKEIIEVDNTDGGIVATCSDGSTYSGKALIGADGLWSTVRKKLVDDSPICSGYVAYRGAVPIEMATVHAPLDEVVAWIGPGMHYVQYPLRSGKLYNQVAVFRSDQYLEGKEDWGNPEELDLKLSAACDHIKAASKLLGKDHRWPMYDRDPIDRWTDGNITLLGDAAHPMLQYLAQGACQAIEDAYVIGEVFKAPHDNVHEALVKYENIRRPHTSRIQTTARTWGDIWHIDGVGMMLRDELFRQRDPDDHTHIEWIYGKH